MQVLLSAIPWSGGQLTTLMLLALRVAVVLAMTPVLYAMPVPGRVRMALVLTLSFVLATGLSSNEESPAIAFGPLIQAAFTELAIGATLGLGITMAFAAFALAGNLLDVQIGFGIAQVFDPVNNRTAPLLVSAFNYAAVIVFFLVDGHRVLLRGLAYSLTVFPIGAPWLIESAIAPVIRQVGTVFALGFSLAAPVVFCMFLVELALGVVSRNLPQINMLVLGIPIKIVVGLAVLSLWFASMGGAMSRIYGSIYNTWDQVFVNVVASKLQAEPQQPTERSPFARGR